MGSRRRDGVTADDSTGTDTGSRSSADNSGAVSGAASALGSATVGKGAAGGCALACSGALFDAAVDFELVFGGTGRCAREDLLRFEVLDEEGLEVLGIVGDCQALTLRDGEVRWTDGDTRAGRSR